jgi:hypothetical protein
MVFQSTSADLWTLQVLKNANALAFFGGNPPQRLNIALVVLVRAVGKVQAGNVHPNLQQLPQSRFRAARRANGADNFRPAILLRIGRARRWSTKSFISHQGSSWVRLLYWVKGNGFQAIESRRYAHRRELAA